MEEKKTLEMVASLENFNITSEELRRVRSGQDYVRFIIQCFAEGSYPDNGPEAFIYDYRPPTLKALRSVWENERKALPKVIQQPAKVIVTERVVGGKRISFEERMGFPPAKFVTKEKVVAKERIPFIELYPINNQKPIALLSRTDYTEDYEIKENNALWSWESRSAFAWDHVPPIPHVILLALTDDTNKVIVYNCKSEYTHTPDKKYIDWKHTKKHTKVNVIGRKICQMTQEEFELTSKV